MISINANAKINLTLDILGSRADGFHEVAMVMQEVSLHDRLTLRRSICGIELKVTGSDLPADESNLCWKAAKLMQDECNLTEGVSIELEKHIPEAAGLAGGSTDAAAVLKGMNQLFELGLTEERLCELGAKLGSDIPFCIMGGTMLATGRGEILQRLPDFPACHVVLAKPAIGVSTAWAYKTYDNGYDGQHPDNVAMLKAIEAGDVQKACGLLCNVLEYVTIGKHEIISTYKELMLQQGAMASMMSGSGPTVFGLTLDKAIAEKMAEAIRKQDAEASVHIAETVAKK